MSTIIPASNVEHVTFCARSPPVETIRQYLLTVICLPLMRHRGCRSKLAAWSAK